MRVRMHQVFVDSGNIAELKIDTDIKTFIYDIPVTLDHFTRTDVGHRQNMKKIFTLAKKDQKKGSSLNAVGRSMMSP